MRNDTLHATIDMHCTTCRTQAHKEGIVLYSEQTGHFLCSQCGYEVLEITFRFEKTSLGVTLESRPAWHEQYSQKVILNVFMTFTGTFKTNKGETIIVINGNQ